MNFRYIFFVGLLGVNLVLWLLLYIFEAYIVKNQQIVLGFDSDMLLLLLHCVVIVYGFGSCVMTWISSNKLNENYLLKDFSRVMVIIVFFLVLSFTYYTVDPKMTKAHELIIKFYKHN